MSDAPSSRRPMEVRFSTMVATMRAFLEPHRAWLDDVLGCPLADALTLELDLPLDHLFLPALLPEVPLRVPPRVAALSPDWPKLTRWALPPGHSPRITMEPFVRPDAEDGWQLAWLPEWKETPAALWLEQLHHAAVAINVPYVNQRTGPEDQTRPWLLVNRAEVAEVLRLLGRCLRQPRKRLYVMTGPDIALPPDSYRWDRVVLDPSTARLVRDDFEAFLQRETWFREHGLPFRRGYLFYGPPGNGKTSAIRVMASHPAITPFTLDLGDEDTDNGTLTRLFAQAGEHTPSLVIFEDIDRMFAREAPEENRRLVTLQHLLNCLDGLGSQEGIIVVATANDPAGLDPAILRRPGRFDRVVEFRHPAATERREFFARQVGARLDDDGLAAAVQSSAGFSFAQLREAYVLAGQTAFTHGGMIGQGELLEGIAQMRTTVTGLSQYRVRRGVGFEKSPIEPVA